MKEKIDTAMIPGSARGTMTNSTACGREAPSVIAACSSSIGIDWKNERNNHMLNGSANVV